MDTEEWPNEEQIGVVQAIRDKKSENGQKMSLTF
tara:strand:+ start:610 stop:711 length:102 start_codon:yes stop_codon:yes gene_type:complete